MQCLLVVVFVASMRACQSPGAGGSGAEGSGTRGNDEMLLGGLSQETSGWGLHEWMVDGISTFSRAWGSWSAAASGEVMRGSLLVAGCESGRSANLRLIHLERC